jgi:thiosulfate/3-mercaptopyruvate sulfurtransferase
VNDVHSKTVITAAELGRLLDSQQPVVLLDVIDEPGVAPDDRPKIPGALSVNLAEDFSGKPTPQGGRRPLPDIGALQAKARAFGIRNDSIVIVYDNAGGAQASRAWWTLRWAGLNNVRIVDGGYGAWIAANRLSSNHVATNAAQAGDVVLTPGHMPTIDADEAAELAKQSKLFDARPCSAYIGDSAKPATGHIPGAIHAASGDNIADGKFKSNDDLRAALLRWARTAATRSGCIAAAAMPQRMQSQPCRLSDLNRRFMSARGRPGAPIHHAAQPRDPSADETIRAVGAWIEILLSDQ